MNTEGPPPGTYERALLDHIWCVERLFICRIRHDYLSTPVIWWCEWLDKRGGGIWKPFST